MKIIIVFAHHDRASFCGAVLERFVAGLEKAGHDSRILDLYAEGFDPVFKQNDMAFFTDDSVPETVLEGMHIRQKVPQLAGGPIRRYLARRWIKNKSTRQIARAIYHRRPKDILEQQERVSEADAVAIISPVFWLGFPAILKGWVERVFTYGFAYQLTPDGWNGDIRGRIPLLRHKKALIINTTFFKQADYEPAFTRAIETVIDSWAFRYPGVEQVEHRYFWAVSSVSAEVRARYLDEAFALGLHFDERRETQSPTAGGEVAHATGG